MGKITRKEIKKLVKSAIETGNWMVRTDDNGSSYNNFKWNPIGEWTEAPDWKPNHNCGNGLHGQSKEASGFKTDGKRVVFCETKGKRYPIPKFHGDKIKVQYARILMINALPSNLIFDGNLDLSNTDIISLPENLSVGGSPYLRGTKITSLPENLSVGGSPYLRGIKIKKTDIPKHLKDKAIF